MPTRVLLLARELNLGGSERQMTEIARGLDRARFEPHVGCFIPEGLRERDLREAGVPILHLPVSSFKSPAAITGARLLTRYVRDHNIQIVHAFDYPMNVFAVPLARWFTRAVALSSQRAHRDLTPPFYLRLLRMTDSLTDGIVVNCEYLRRHLMEDYAVPRERIHLCYNGIDLDSFCRCAPKPLRRLVTIGTVCALRPEKSLGTLLDAFAQLRTDQALRLAVVGDGPELEGLRHRAAALGITDRVDFHPATEEVPRELGNIDIFVLPSRTEAFSNSLMEAMACGCASIASNVGGNPELIRHGETGLLFESGNAAALAEALGTLIRDEPLRRRLAEAGHDFLHQNFSLASSAQRMAEIYESMLTHGRRQ